MKTDSYFKTITYIAVVLFFNACMEKEIPVLKHSSGDVTTATINMNIDYRYQVYYDLSTNTIVGQNLKIAWDLGFETTPAGWHIILNSAKAMYAFNTGKSDFMAVTDTIGLSLGKKFDAPTGSLDSTGVGDWQKSNSVYIIDRGFNEAGIHQGFRKIMVLSVDNEKYTVKYAQLNGNAETTLHIPKDTTYNFSFLSFTTDSTLIIEPPKAAWDVVFTQYLEALSEPYLVCGCVLNRYNTFSAMDSSAAFESITMNTIQSKMLLPEINTIGYSWKEYSFSTSQYEVFPQMNYLIKDNEGFYYKLHFIDFYDQSGNKGNPTWEYQKL